jgi:PAS domain S-box-containing protein
LPDAEVGARSAGVLSVEFDTRVLAQGFLARSWLLLLTGIAQALALGLVLAVVTHLMVTRPLARLVDAVERVDPEAPERPVLRLGPSHERDELGRLVSALDRLTGRFRAALAQRQEALGRLAASEARYRAVVDTQTEFIQRVTPDGRLSFVSDAYCRYYGRPREELLGRIHNEFTLTVPEDRERDAAHLGSLAPEHPSEMIELRRQLPDGRIRWVQWNDTAIFDAEGRLVEIQSVGRDVTERVAAEARFLAAAETLPDGLAIFDAEDRLVYHNRRYPELQVPNVREAIAVGKRFEDLVRDALARGPIHHPDMGEGFVERRLAMRRLAYSEHEQHLADGRWVRVREARMADGGLVLLTSDITRARALEAELRQAEKLKAVGTLASGIAHDLNNILATIFTSTEVALLQLAEDAPARAALDRVLGAGRRGRQLASQVLTFSRGERTPRAAIELGAAVAGAVELCRPALDGDVEVRCDRPGCPVFVAADEAQVHRIVSNLCLNAAQAMPDGGRISVRVDGGEEGRDGRRWAKLRVRDSGSGMDAETAARAFEPFFTTKPVGQGTGLGLAVVHGTVEALGGRIRLRTAPGRGSVFTVALPCIAREGADPAAPAEALPAGEGRTAFLVEPEDEAAEAVGVMLRRAGYRVARHADPAGALEAFSASRRRAALLVAAVPLPPPGGVELARAMRRLAPRLGVVLLAPTPPTPAELAAAEAAGWAIVARPVLRRELAAAVARQLERPGKVPPRARAGDGRYKVARPATK